MGIFHNIIVKMDMIVTFILDTYLLLRMVFMLLRFVPVAFSDVYK